MSENSTWSDKAIWTISEMWASVSSCFFFNDKTFISGTVFWRQRQAVPLGHTLYYQKLECSRLWLHDGNRTNNMLHPQCCTIATCCLVKYLRHILVWFKTNLYPASFLHWCWACFWQVKRSPCLNTTTDEPKFQIGQFRPSRSWRINVLVSKDQSPYQPLQFLKAHGRSPFTHQ